LGKAIPVLSIALDVASIVETWTGNNETLDQAKQLQGQLKTNIEAFRKAVKDYQSSIEEQLGPLKLRDTLRKLIRLGKKPPPAPPPLSPEGACKLFKSMEAALNVPLMMFVDILQGFKDKFISDEDDEADMSKLSYAAEAVRKEDVHDLSQKLMTAPVIDSVFERYPQDVDRQDDQVRWSSLSSQHSRLILVCSRCRKPDLYKVPSGSPLAAKNSEMIARLSHLEMRKSITSQALLKINALNPG
jgi:hypothetical protein